MIQYPQTEVGMMETILTVEEVAEKLKVSEAVVRELLRRGEVKGRKVGKVWRVLESDLENYMRADDKEEGAGAETD